jgi:hypothetical protein
VAQVAGAGKTMALNLVYHRRTHSPIALPPAWIRTAIHRLWRAGGHAARREALHPTGSVTWMDGETFSCTAFRPPDSSCGSVKAR